LYDYRCGEIGRKATRISKRGKEDDCSPHGVFRAEAGIFQREEAILWAASGTASETSIVKGGVESEITTDTRLIMRASTVEMSTVATESADSLFVQKYIAIQYPPVKEGVSSTVRLGRALVSGALGMRTDNPKLFETAIRLPDCSVVIRSTKKKTKAPVSAPPPNSIDSEMDMNDSADIQLSQSTTDVVVQIELAGLGVEAMLQEILAKEEVMISDKPIMTEAPPMPGLIVTPDTSPVKVNRTGDQREESGGEISREKETPSEGKIVRKGDLTTLELQRILKEIENSKLLREELKEQDLSLASASSFLNVVCGRTSKNKGLQKTREIQGKPSGSKVGVIAYLTKEQLEDKYLKKQRVIRIIAAKSLLKEELAKAEPSWAPVATFRAAAGRGEEPGSGEVVDVRRAVREGQPAQSDTPTTVNTLTMEAPVPYMTAMSQPRAIIELQAEAPPVIGDDAPMSIGDSEEEGSESDGSDGFSGSGISCRDSTVSRGSLKRPADESPERELGETSRQNFQG